MKRLFCLTLTVILAMSAGSCASGESAPSDANVSVSESVPIIETSEVTAMSSSQESSGGTPTFEESTTKESISTESKESEIKVPSFSLPVSTTDLPPQTDPDSYFLYGTVLPEGNYLLISITANQYASMMSSDISSKPFVIPRMKSRWTMPVYFHFLVFINIPIRIAR